MSDKFEINAGPDNGLLRTLINVYMTIKPETTQVDIANRLGVKQMTVSRIVNMDSYNIRPEWVSVMHEMLAEIDLDAYIIKLHYLSKIRNHYMEERRSRITGEIITKYLEQTTNKAFEYLGSAVELKLNILTALSIEDQEEWRFLDVDTFAKKFGVISMNWKSLFMRTFPISSERTVIFTMDEDRFFDILSCYQDPSTADLGRGNGVIYAPKAIMLIDFEKECIVRNIEIGE